MIIELPMGYSFIAPENEEEPYIINSYGEKVVSTMISDTALATTIYLAMKNQISEIIEQE